MEKYVCIHGHFYQPPRENPWLEEVEQQDSAYPYHDWNERITLECYAPNAVARMLDGEGKIVNLVNNYASISFNFGPTLLSWLQQKNFWVYQAILEADRQSRQRFGGHGAALAQAYNHMIMPLANDRDKYTQLVWGMRDFQHRFGRKSEGLWLPETAVDLKTLEHMASLGIKFTILSPYQAGKVRRLAASASSSEAKGAAGEEWADASDGRLDPTTAYIQKLPSGKSITLFFYDGPISRAVAFEKLLAQGENLANRLLTGFTNQRPWPQLVHIATDGESYGHHHPHGDMALAYALHEISKNPEVRLTIYGEYLEKHPPTHEVQIVENTAWSCAHGVERWRSDCGCNSGRAGWKQTWRGPLREALDWLRDAVIPLFEEKAGKLLREPWAARNDYIRVILDRSPESVQRFLLDHAAKDLDPAEKIVVLKLMETQRQAMLMYTSCGWFFDEISGIESVQIIQYAGRLIQLAQDLFGTDLEGPFLERLAKAKSNLPEVRDGRAIYLKWVKPAVVGWEQITAHYAVNSLFETYPDTVRVYCYTAERTDYHSLSSGRSRLVLGRAKVTSEITEESAALSFGVLHFGDHNVNGGVRKLQSADPKIPKAADASEGTLDEYDTLRKELTKAFERADFPQIIRLFDKGFGESTYSLKSLFRDEQRKVVHHLLEGRIAETEQVYRRMYEENLPMMRFLADISVPLPPPLRTAMVYVIGLDLRLALTGDEPDLANAQRLLDEAVRWHIPLDAAGLAFIFKRTLTRLAENFRNQPLELSNLLALEQAVELAARLPFEVDLWYPQNVYVTLLRTLYPDLEAKAQGDETAQVWLEHFVVLGEQLRVQVGDVKKKSPSYGKPPPSAACLTKSSPEPASPELPTESNSTSASPSATRSR